MPLAQVTGPDGDLRAERIEIVLARSENGVDRLEAYNRVTTVLGARTATGSRMTYHAREERYVMSGVGVTPVSLRESSCRETTGRTVTFFKSSDRIIVDGNETRRTENQVLHSTASVESAPAIASHAMTSSTLQTKELTKSYGGRTVVRGVSIEVASGEIVGCSGRTCGARRRRST